MKSLVFISGLALAMPLFAANLNLHGFVSQAVLKTSAHNFYGDSSRWSTDYTELGLNAFSQVTNQLSVAAQVVAQHHGVLTELNDPIIDYLQISYRSLIQANRDFEFSVGRIKVPFGLYNETREIPFTKPSIFLPEVIYREPLRDILTSADGVKVQAAYYFTDSELRASLMQGRPKASELLNAYFFSDYQRQVDIEMQAQAATAFNLRWATLNNSLILNYSYMHLDFAHKLRGNIFSLQYAKNNHKLTGELLHNTFEREAVPVLGLPGDDIRLNAYYLQYEYEYKQATLLFRYEREAVTSQYYPQFFSLTPEHLRQTQAYTLGLSYRATTNTLFRAQYTYNHGLTTLDRTDNHSQMYPTDWSMLALSISYRF